MKINIKNNIYNLNLDDLIVMGKRANNEKRNFLFISKVLGKHIELKPDVCKSIGFLLASLLCGEIGSENALKNNIIDGSEVKEIFSKTYSYKENICVLGFAETATGLGMAVASAIKDSFYLTTTRENIKEIKSILNFEEEHSHATTHKVFLDDLTKLSKVDRIVLVDDEITTGNSMLNIIKELKKVTGIKKYTILSILDWRNKEYLDLYESFKTKENVEIKVLSLINGNIENDDKTVFYDNENNLIEDKKSVIDLNIIERVCFKTNYGQEQYIKNSGRFGVSHNDIIDIERVAKNIAIEIENTIGKADSTLVLGHGENIYIPSRVAAYLNGDAYFKSTTRSPILCSLEEGYPINEKHVFYDKDVKYYFYNKKNIEEKYDRVILLTENDLDVKLTDNIYIFKI